VAGQPGAALGAPRSAAAALAARAAGVRAQTGVAFIRSLAGYFNEAFTDAVGQMAPHDDEATASELLPVVGALCDAAARVGAAGDALAMCAQASGLPLLAAPPAGLPPQQAYYFQQQQQYQQAQAQQAQLLQQYGYGGAGAYAQQPPPPQQQPPPSLLDARHKLLGRAAFALAARHAPSVGADGWTALLSALAGLATSETIQLAPEELLRAAADAAARAARGRRALPPLPPDDLALFADEAAADLPDDTADARAQPPTSEPRPPPPPPSWGSLELSLDLRAQPPSADAPDEAKAGAAPDGGAGAAAAGETPPSGGQLLAPPLGRAPAPPAPLGGGVGDGAAAAVNTARAAAAGALGGLSSSLGGLSSFMFGSPAGQALAAPAAAPASADPTAAGAARLASAPVALSPTRALLAAALVPTPPPLAPPPLAHADEAAAAAGADALAAAPAPPRALPPLSPLLGALCGVASQPQLVGLPDRAAALLVRLLGALAVAAAHVAHAAAAAPAATDAAAADARSALDGVRHADALLRLLARPPPSAAGAAGGGGAIERHALIALMHTSATLVELGADDAPDAAAAAAAAEPAGGLAEAAALLEHARARCLPPRLAAEGLALGVGVERLVRVAAARPSAPGADALVRAAAALVAQLGGVAAAAGAEGSCARGALAGALALLEAAAAGGDAAEGAAEGALGALATHGVPLAVNALAALVGAQQPPAPEVARAVVRALALAVDAPQAGGGGDGGAGERWVSTELPALRALALAACARADADAVVALGCLHDLVVSPRRAHLPARAWLEAATLALLPPALAALRACRAPTPLPFARLPGAPAPSAEARATRAAQALFAPLLPRLPALIAEPAFVPAWLQLVAELQHAARGAQCDGTREVLSHALSTALQRMAVAGFFAPAAAPAGARSAAHAVWDATQRLLDELQPRVIGLS
jgi:hypothetical protein